MKKFVKIVKKRIPWISHIINETTSHEFYMKRIKLSKKTICILCRMSRGLCGQSPCPLYHLFDKVSKVRSLVINKKHIIGSSPPGLFVGHSKYPYVNVGPLVAPIVGNVETWDTPEQWINITFNQLINYRLSLIRGFKKTHVKDLKSKITEKIQELALSKNSVCIDAKFTKPPRGKLIDGELRPLGPKAEIKDIQLDGIKTHQLLEKYFNDDEIRAEDALFELRKRGVLVSNLIRAFSAGLLGIKSQRKLVPTRWSITAVDSLLSLKYIQKLRAFDKISEIRVYEGNLLNNKFVVIMIPDAWSFEWLEAWWPRTAFNFFGTEIAICGDYELRFGRDSYAKVGGCYYASRLAVSEFLFKIKKQATVIVLREIYPTPENMIPLGVWLVREGVRLALETKPFVFDDLKQVFAFLNNKLRLKVEDWISSSSLLSMITRQRHITEFLNS